MHWKARNYSALRRAGKECAYTMKKRKKFLCLLLALVMAGSLLLLPAAAANTQSGATRYPTVYVHGLMGWGEHDQIYSAVPYWGLSTDLMPYMTSKGYESYAASVGPLSSAWDRACELYAQLTGTTVDYGAAHAAEYGHARYGATYDKPLFAGWSASKEDQPRRPQLRRRDHAPLP